MENYEADEKELHKQFVKLGNYRRKLTNELLALLPEINERGIYKKYASSIVEYAGKFGGLSKGVVLKRLRLEKYLYDKPNLKEAIKTEGIHKVGMMASLATQENEEFIVDKIKNMSKSAVQELSKEMRANEAEVGQGLFANDGDVTETVNCKAVPQRITVELDEDTSFLFLKLKKKIGKNLSNREVMKEVLKMAEHGLNGMAKNIGNARSKNEKHHQPTDSKVIPGDNFSSKTDVTKKHQEYKIDINDYILQPPTNRYIPSKIKKQIISQTNGKCSYPNCNKPAEIFHHTDRFAENQSHQSLKLLCKEHHEFAHNGLIKNEKRSVDQWCLNLRTGEIIEIDKLYRNFRKSDLGYRWG